MAEVRPYKELKASCLNMDGISKEEVDQHYGILYKGYVNKLNEIRQNLETVDYSAANQSYSALRAAKVDETFCLNGAKLHEWYFDNLGGKGGPATGRIRELIDRDFGSWERFELEFKATGMAVRGWAVLAYDLDDGKLHIYGQDAHNVGVPWGAYPLLILDVYEHAYGIDYGVKRAPYIDAFMKNIDWDEVNARLAKYNI
ncbi:Superoxide dismutase [Fe] [Candidatus Hydrogenisulfobacillus filiaventi]|uniref:superoxide dismutase n=1 Tax=Candidatus Hydrogenisulfobacillus filiaventi TaxID=2707344 RepID=A0A6F8ZF65_9FIRM|nr:superoxide dismutase [Bacillota bacterium]CAB1128239.1 Superoxide dismutase [Fe] [Candidatus Hydrogenisulfobacillus filiaventi]